MTTTRSDRLAAAAAANESTVAAVVVTYNRRELLRECLRALAGQTYQPDQILVLDNGSTDGTGRMVAREFPQVDCSRLYPNIGCSGGFHEAVRLAHERGYDWIWLMDDDCRPASQALEKLMRHGVEGARDTVYGSVMVAEGSGDHLAYPTALFANGRRVLCTSLRDFPASHVVPTDSIGYNGLLLPREVVSVVGFPSKDFYIWWDDVEYAWRITHDYRYKMGYVTDSIVYHPAAGYRRFRFLGLTGHYIRAAPWKQYYGVRNHLLLDRKYNPRWKFWLMVVPRRVLFLHLGILLWERSKLPALWHTWHGLLDGILGNTGCRVQPS